MAKAKKTKNGKWTALVYVGKKADGSREYKRFTADTANEADFLAAQAKLEFKGKANAITRNNISFKEALERYIISKENVLSPSTVRGYRILQRNAFEMINLIKIKDLTEYEMQTQMNANAAKYSAKSIKNQYGLISAVLKQNKIKLDKPTLKKEARKEMLIPTQAQAAQILRITKGTNIEWQILCALLLGLRQSEILGNNPATNYENGILKIRGASVPNELNQYEYKETNKSAAGTRDILLPEYMQHRLEELISSGYTFKMTPSGVLKKFKRLCRNNGLPEFTIHSLRHFNASIMLMLNVPDKYAMKRLGQSSNHVLKNVYQATFSDEEIQIADTISKYIDTTLTM